MFRTTKILCGILVIEIIYKLIIINISSIFQLVQIDRQATNITTIYSAYGIISICLFAFWEELTSRFLSTIHDWIGAIWLVLYPYLIILNIATKFLNYQYSFLDSTYIVLGLLGLIIIDKHKPVKLYKLFFSRNKFKYTISILFFCLAHIVNYSIPNYQSLMLAVLYVILVYLPSSCMYLYVHLNVKSGLFFATFLHTAHNMILLFL
jgi:drug/metabolite transporter superfamily protein YnfA